MTYSARLVLNDCHLALQMLEDEKDLDKWRVLWVGAVSLLRAVGHVLHKVDGNNALRKLLISCAYNNWKLDRVSNELFWEFIEKERNSILKEYSSEVHPNDEVQVAVQMKAVSPHTGEEVLVRECFSIDENIYRPLVSGFREGDDARDVYTEALEWWDRQLLQIEIFEAMTKLSCRCSKAWPSSPIQI